MVGSIIAIPAIFLIALYFLFIEPCVGVKWYKDPTADRYISPEPNEYRQEQITDFIKNTTGKSPIPLNPDKLTINYLIGGYLEPGITIYLLNERKLRRIQSYRSTRTGMYIDFFEHEVTLTSTHYHQLGNLLHHQNILKLKPEYFEAFHDGSFGFFDLHLNEQTKRIKFMNLYPKEIVLLNAWFNSILQYPFQDKGKRVPHAEVKAIYDSIYTNGNPDQPIDVSFPVESFNN